MSNTVIEVRNLSKKYRLGVLNHGMLYKDLQSWWARLRGKEDPNSVIGHEHKRVDKGDFWALDDVSFDIQQGDIVGVIGRNGAGKSTLLKIISRLTTPTTGSVRIRGRVASLLEVGTGFHPELTGRENVFLNGSILGMRRHEIQRKFDEIVAFAGIDDFIDTPVKRYSSGMYVRLAFAVAAHLESEILIVDEVLAVGDAAFQKKCLGKMGEVSKIDGRTVLLVSHNLPVIKQNCRTGIFLESGKVEHFGNIEDTLHEYWARILTTRNSSAIVHVEDIPNKYGMGEIKVQSLELLNATGSAFAVAFDQDILLRISFRADKKIPELGIALSFMTMENVAVFTVRSNSAGNWFQVDKGVWQAKIRIAHTLRAGIYSLILGIYSSNKQVLYHNENLAQLEILEDGKKPYAFQNYGLVDFQAAWELQSGKPE
jgi:lipopolysaccharide transport system ATP-binding protein